MPAPNPKDPDRLKEVAGMWLVWGADGYRVPSNTLNYRLLKEL